MAFKKKVQQETTKATSWAGQWNLISSQAKRDGFYLVFLDEGETAWGDNCLGDNKNLRLLASRLKKKEATQ